MPIGNCVNMVWSANSAALRMTWSAALALGTGMNNFKHARPDCSDYLPVVY